MNTGFILSKRLLYATVFGAIIIGGAVYLSQKEIPSPEKKVSPPKQQTETFTSASNVPEEVIEPTNTPKPAAEQELTETDRLTRNILQPYLTQASADKYSPASGARIIEDATKEMFTLEVTPLEASDITTSQDTTTESALQYKKDLYTAIKPIFELDEYELTLYARAVQDNSKEDFDTLLTVAEIYKQASEGALLVIAPNDISAVHLDIINSLNTFSVVLDALAKGYDDPAASLAGTGNFTQAEEGISQAFSQLQTYFILKEVDKISI